MSHSALSQRLALLIREEGLRPGAKLPSERVLAVRLGVSRASLREALSHLAVAGRLVSRPGSGHFLQTKPLELAPLPQLIRQNPSYWQDVMEIRRALEGEAAYYAALRATDSDHARLRAYSLTLSTSKDPQAEAQADANLHLLIAESSHNLVLLHTMRGLFELLESSISHSLTKLHTRPQTVRILTRQHQALLNAIMAGQPEQARKQALLHLDFVAATLRRIEDDEARHHRLTPHPQKSPTP